MMFTKNSKAGFTLVELMVVVAIIGILSAIAIPNFKKYQAKSKTSEAKLQLAALFTAEISFATDFDVYATCLDTMGFDPSANEKTRYYAIGFSTKSDAANNDATENGADDACKSSDNYWYPSGKKVGGQAADSASYLGDDSVVNYGDNEFKAAAGGILDASKKTADKADRWTINQDKLLDHDQTGY